MIVQNTTTILYFPGQQVTTLFHQQARDLEVMSFFLYNVVVNFVCLIFVPFFPKREKREITYAPK